MPRRSISPAQTSARTAKQQLHQQLQDRKLRTRRLIELGGLVTKAKLDHLPANALYGALLNLSKQLHANPNIIGDWAEAGHLAFEQHSYSTTPVILIFYQLPTASTKANLRQLGLRFNRFRQEWYGNISELSALQQTLLQAHPNHTDYYLEIISVLT